MKTNQILNLFETYSDSNPRDNYITDECLKKMEMIAKNDPVEFKNLIDLFNQQTDTFEKLNLSDILTNLKYEKVKDFLWDVITKKEKIPTELDLGHKIGAAGNLLKFKDEKAIQPLKNFIQLANKEDIRWIVHVLVEVKNKLAITLLLEFADKYEEVRKLIDRSYFENKLKEYK